MRKLLWIVCIGVSVLVRTAFGQGLVRFANDTTTLITNWVQSPPPLPSWGAPGSYYFGLLISPLPSGPFTFTGVYSTNAADFGLIGPNSYTPAVPAWPIGQAMYYEVAGWSASLGPTFDPGWLKGNFASYGLFGVSGVANGIAGGGATPPLPPLGLFAGSGLAGFSLAPVGSPPTVAVPDLNIVSNDQGIVLIWNLPTQNFVLQENTNLAMATGWTDMVVNPTIDYATVHNETALSRPGGTVFYRLALVGQAGVVYGSNVVGYITIPVQPGYNLLANPLNGGVTNGANEIMPILDGETILTWNEAAFVDTMYDSTAGGWVQTDDVTPAPPPQLPPGKGFFLFCPSPITTNFAFMGQVVPRPGTTNCLELPPGYSLIGSPLPVTVLQITDAPMSLPRIDGMIIAEWNGLLYDEKIYEGFFPTPGWTLADGVTPSTAPPCAIGQGFFIFNPNSGAAFCWPQTLP